MLLVLQATLLKLVCCESLLHALADKVLRSWRNATQDLAQADQGGDEALIETRLRVVNLVKCVDQAALLAEVRQLCQLLFIDHVKSPCRAYRQDDSQVEQIILLQLLDAVRVDASPHVLLLIQAIILVDQVAEFVLQQLRLVAEIFDIAAHQLTQTQMLVQRRRCLVLALEDVAEAGAEAHFTSAIEDNLRTGQIRMSHVVFV